MAVSKQFSVAVKIKYVLNDTIKIVVRKNKLFITNDAAIIVKEMDVSAFDASVTFL